MNPDTSGYSDWSPFISSENESTSESESSISGKSHWNNCKKSKQSLNLKDTLSEALRNDNNSTTHIRKGIGKKDSRALRHELQMNELRTMLKRDALSVDMKWSLFVTASECYDCNLGSAAQFPSKFRNDPQDGGKTSWSQLKITSNSNINSRHLSVISRVIDNAPPNDEIFRKIFNPSYELSLSTDLVELMYWVLITRLKPHLSTLDPDQVENFCQKFAIESQDKPYLIFELIHSSSAMQCLWNERCSETGYTTKIAYLSPKLGHVHSILHNGAEACLVQGKDTKKGIYLSQNLSWAKARGIKGCSWSGSLIGTELTCVAQCEIIMHPDLVSLQTLQNLEAIRKNLKNCEYFVVTDPGLIIVRHLIFFSEDADTRKLLNKKSSPGIEIILIESRKPFSSLWTSIFSVVAMYCALILISTSLYPYWQNWS